MYTVRCENPRSADVICHRGPVVESQHKTLNEALAMLWLWYIPGPNGPARSAMLLRDGIVVDGHAECKRLGKVPLYRGSHIVGCN